MNSNSRQTFVKLLFDELAVLAAQTFRTSATRKSDRWRRGLSGCRFGFRPGAHVWPLLSCFRRGFDLRPGARVWPLLNFSGCRIGLWQSLRFGSDLPHIPVDGTPVDAQKSSNFPVGMARTVQSFDGLMRRH
jgi:hypothetical protein